MSVDAAQLAALRDRVDVHDTALLNARATVDELFELMQSAIREAGLDPNAADSHRRDRHGMQLLKGGRA